MNASEIRDLLDFVAKSGLDEVNIETNEIKLRVKKHTSAKIHQNIIQSPGVPSMPHDSTALVATSAPYPATPPAPETAPTGAQENTKQKYLTIKSPMIGTFYQSPNPEAGPFVQVGDKVKKGQTVCIIEAMKLFNEIESEHTGTIVEMLVDDASPVEFDQPLFAIDPS